MLAMMILADIYYAEFLILLALWIFEVLVILVYVYGIKSSALKIEFWELIRQFFPFWWEKKCVYRLVAAGQNVQEKLMQREGN